MKKVISIIGLPLISILIYFFFYKYNLVFECLFNKLTHLYCPGCGITRLIDSLIHLDIYQAFRYNMLSFILLPFILAYIQYKFICYGFKIEDKITRKIPNKIIYIIIVIYIVFGILRNIELFNFLAPTVI